MPEKYQPQCARFAGRCGTRVALRFCEGAWRCLAKSCAIAGWSSASRSKLALSRNQLAAQTGNLQNYWSTEVDGVYVQHIAHLARQRMCLQLRDQHRTQLLQGRATFALNDQLAAELAGLLAEGAR